MSWDGRGDGWSSGNGDTRKTYPDGQQEPRTNPGTRRHLEHVANGGTTESFFEDQGLGQLYACTMGTCEHTHHPSR